MLEAVGVALVEAGVEVDEFDGFVPTQVTVSSSPHEIG